MGGEDLYGSLSLGGIFQGWDVLREHLLHFGNSADGFKITAAMGDVKDFPIPIVVSYEQGWYPMIAIRVLIIDIFVGALACAL